MTALFGSPPVYDLPFTKGDDLSVRFVYKTPVLDGDNNPVVVDGKVQYQVADYPDGSSVTLEIDTKPPRAYAATITGSDADIHEPFSDVDGVIKGLSWRAKIVFGTGLTKVAAHGKTIRND